MPGNEPATRGANVLLGSRFRLLAAQTLVHYPALWWASQHGRVPLHVSVTSAPGGVTMIAGPSGVGKSTMLSAGLPHGEIATADNVCACDSRTAYGLVEPLRIEGGPAAPAAPHGRREVPLTGRVPCLDPDRLVVLGRAAAGEKTTVRPLSPGEAARALVAGTYMAGELRRFWPLAATLALATGMGRRHPDVRGIARARRAAALHRRAGRARLAERRSVNCCGWQVRHHRLAVAVVVTRLQAGAGGVALRGALALDPDRYQVTIIAGDTDGSADADGSGDQLLARAAEAGLRVGNLPELVSPISPRQDLRCLHLLTDQAWRRRATT